MKAKIIINPTPNLWRLAKKCGKPIQLDGSTAYYYNNKLYITSCVTTYGK